MQLSFVKHHYISITFCQPNCNLLNTIQKVIKFVCFVALQDNLGTGNTEFIKISSIAVIFAYT